MGVLGVVWKWGVLSQLASLGNDDTLTLSRSWVLVWLRSCCAQLPKDCRAGRQRCSWAVTLWRCGR